MSTLHFTKGDVQEPIGDFQMDFARGLHTLGAATGLQHRNAARANEYEVGIGSTDPAYAKALGTFAGQLGQVRTAALHRTNPAVESKRPIVIPGVAQKHKPPGHHR